MSGEHCAVASRGEAGAEVRDLGSANGTYVNEVRLPPGSSVGLKPGDSVALADRAGPRFILRDAGQQRARASAVAEAASADAEGPGELEGALAATAAHGKRPAPDGGAPSAGDPRRRRITRKRPEERPGAAEAAEGACGGAGGTESASTSPASEKASPEAAAGHRLIDVTTGTAHRLPAVGIAALGRRPDCEIVVKHPAVSSRHCIFACSEGWVEVEDVGSNGTYINGVLVPKGIGLPQRVALRHGDRLSLACRGGPSLLFLDAAAGAAVGPAAGGA